jgi:hypothetical protein
MKIQLSDSITIIVQDSGKLTEYLTYGEYLEELTDLLRKKWDLRLIDEKCEWCGKEIVKPDFLQDSSGKQVCTECYHDREIALWEDMRS